MKTFVKLALGSLLAVGVLAHAKPGKGHHDHDHDFRRPGSRYVYVGSFSVSNPFKHDRDTVHVRRQAFWSAMALELDSGADVDLDEIEIYCSRHRKCAEFNVRRDIEKRRPMVIRFRRDLPIDHIVFKAKPRGIPPAKVRVYLAR